MIEQEDEEVANLADELKAKPRTSKALWIGMPLYFGPTAMLMILCGTGGKPESMLLSCYYWMIGVSVIMILLSCAGLLVVGLRKAQPEPPKKPLEWSGFLILMFLSSGNCLMGASVGITWTSIWYVSSLILAFSVAKMLE